jgi:hypothetical protein
MTCDWDEIVLTIVPLFVKNWCACKPGQHSHMEQSEHIHHSQSFPMFFCPYSLLCSFPTMSPGSSWYWVFYKTLGQDSVSSSYRVHYVLSLTCHWQWLIMNVTIHQAFIGLMMAYIFMSQLDAICLPGELLVDNYIIFRFWLHMWRFNWA